MFLPRQRRPPLPPPFHRLRACPRGLRSTPTNVTEATQQLPAGDATAAVPPAVERRERRLLLGLMTALVVAALVGFLTIPNDAALLDRATHEPDVESRIEAMNALVVRGYWADRSLEDLQAFLKDSPAPLRQFMADMHGGLLQPRRN